MSKPLKNIAVLVSGRGSNLAALLQAQKEQRLSSGRIVAVVSNQSEAKAQTHAHAYQVPYHIIPHQHYQTRADFEQAIIEYLHPFHIDWVVLAGFMRRLSSHFCTHYQGRIINLHPSLLPAFKGAHAIQEAFDYGVRVTGVSVHLVTEDLDAGPIIAQEALTIDDNDTLSSLTERIHEIEHRLLPEVVENICNNKITLRHSTSKIY